MWVRKKKLGIVVAALLLVGALAGALAWEHRGYTLATLHAGSQMYTLRVANTPPAQQKGLGGLYSLPKNQGMLFTFSGPDVRCFWMKDMRFPLDVIWLDAGKQVVHVERNVAPATFPDEFCPNTPAQYVIELNAGEAARANIQPGETLTF